MNEDNDPVLTEEECDGSGNHPLCAKTYAHKHCECGMPMYKKATRCWLCYCESRGLNLHRHGNLIRQSLQRIDHEAPEDAGYSSFKNRDSVGNYGEGFVSFRLQGKWSYKLTN